MWFVVIGTLLTLLKAFDVALVETSWLWVLSPFVGAVVWWWWADMSGYTKRRAMDKMELRKEERRRKHLVDMGMDERGRRVVKK
jgi:small Trp-rich protein